MNKNEKERWLRYRKPSCSNLHRCKVNELNIFINNTYEHEKAKFDKFWELRKAGFKVLTECEEISTKLRRDLVDISNGEIYEFETDRKRAERHPKYINVIMVSKSTKATK